MKKILCLLSVLLLTQCSSPNYPVKVIKRAVAMQPGKPMPQGVLQPGETVTLVPPVSLENNAAEVILADGKHVFVPLSALELPDSLRTGAKPAAR